MAEPFRGVCAAGVTVLQTLPELKIWAGEARWAPVEGDERPGKAAEEGRVKQ